MLSPDILRELEEQAKKLDFSELKGLDVIESANPQQTEEWYQARRYKFTSSSIYKLMTEPKTKGAKEKGELSETAKTYIMEKIAEKVGGFIPDAKGPALDWGNENEDKAREAYAKQTGNTLEQVGFIKVTDFFGGSPDNIVLNNLVAEDHLGGLEIKCPYNTVNHMWHRLINSPEYFKACHADYYWQCVSHMKVLDVNWCDFVSYDPRLSDGHSLFIFTLKRNKEVEEQMMSRIEKAVEYKNNLMAQLNITP